MKLPILILFSAILAAIAAADTTMTVTALNTPAKLVDATEGGQIVTDVSKFAREGKFVLSAKSEAGSSPTLDVKIQNAATRDFWPQVVGAGDTSIVSRTAANAGIRLAAKFVVAAATTRTIESVTIPLKKNGTVASGTLTLALQADNTAVPSGTDLITATSAAADVPASYTGTTFTFSKPYDLTQGTYWIVLTSDVTADATNNIEWRADAVASGGNAATHNGTSYSAVATKNLQITATSYQFADVSGLTFTQVTTTGSVQTKSKTLESLAYIRPHVTIGGTGSPAFFVSTLIIGNSD